jgi:hypothetical protein
LNDGTTPPPGTTSCFSGFTVGNSGC